MKLLNKTHQKSSILTKELHLTLHFFIPNEFTHEMKKNNQMDTIIVGLQQILPAQLDEL